MVISATHIALISSCRPSFNLSLDDPAVDDKVLFNSGSGTGSHSSVVRKIVAIVLEMILLLGW